MIKKIIKNKKVKKLSISLAIIAGIVSVGFYSCEKTIVAPTSAATTIMEEPRTVIAPALWRISSFQWHNREDNNHFIDYTFKFDTYGVVMANHNHVNEVGRWSKRNNIMQITFGTSPLNELNNNWTITGHTSTSIVLRGLSPYDNSSEFVIFEKVNSPSLVEGK